jgi:hypothetical protein
VLEPLRHRPLVYATASVLVALGLLVLVVALVGPAETRATLSRLRGEEVGALLASAFVVAACASLSWQTILARYGHRVPAWLLFRLVLLVFAVGWMIPSGFVAGIPLAAYLLRRHGVPVSRSIASFLISRFLEVSAYALILPAVLLGDTPLGTTGRWLLFVPLATLGLVYLDLLGGWRLARRALRRVAPALPRRLLPLVERTVVFLAIIAEFFRLRPRRLVLLAAAYSVLGIVIEFGRSLLVSRFLGLGLDVAQVALLFAFTVVVLAIPLLPGAIGVYEGGLAGLFGLIGHPPAEGLAYAATLHAIGFIVVATGLVFLAQLGLTPARLRDAADDGLRER